MVLQNALKLRTVLPQIAYGRLLWGVLAIFLLSLSIYAQTQISEPDENTLIIENAPQQEIFAFGKTVIVKQNVKGVLAFGGNIIVEGKIDGDAAVIGGSIIQKKNAYIGGDVIIFGGKYEPESDKPLRGVETETVMYAGYEEELKNLTQNPSQIFSPAWSWQFLIQRILSLLFWFGIAFAISFITPGAISRAAARSKLSTLKIFGIGSLAFLVVNLSVILSIAFLPGFLSFIVSLMAFVIIMLAYVFGRVAMQASIGKWLLKRITADTKPSETNALLIGTLFWTILLSIPYIWIITLFTLFAASLGLVLTARSTKNWESA